MSIPKSYIFFEPRDAGDRKTKIWYVRTLNTNEILGTIGFRPAWRKYVFDTQLASFDAGCLQEITDFLKTQTRAWKEGL